MKKVSKVLIALIFSIAVLVTAVVPAFAATTPAQVTGLKVSSVTYNSVTLKWSAAKNSKYYQVYQSTDGKTWKQVGSDTKNTTMTVSKLTVGKTYKFKVRGEYKLTSISKATYGKYSSVVSGKPMPAQVTGFKATAVTGTKTTLSWTKVEGSTGYYVQQYVSSKWKTVKTLTANTVTLTGFTPNATQTFRVAAYKTVSGKTYTGTYSATLKVKNVVGQVTAVKAAQKTPDSATISWKAVTEATGYYVQQYNASTKKWATVKTITKGSTVSAVISSLVPDTSYQVRVQAYQTVSKKTYTGAVSSTVTVKTTIAAPTALKVSSIKTTSVVLKWTASTTSGISGYYVYNGSKQIAKLDSTTTTYTVKSLSPATTYKFTVYAYYSTIKKGVSASTTTACTAPANLVCNEITTTTADISWDAVTGAKKYYVYNNGTKIGETEKTYYSVTGLKASTAYSFTVSAVNSANAEGAKSTAVSATSPAKDISGITLTADVIGETAQSYKLTWSYVGTYGKYTYNVADTMAEGQEAYPSTYKFSTKIDAFTATATEASGYTTVTWPAVEGTRYYEVQTAANADNYKSWTVAATTEDTSAKVILPAGTTVPVRVVAYNRVLSVTAYAVNDDYTKGAQYSGKRVIKVPGAISSVCEVNTATYNYSATDNMSKTKAVLAVVNAINKTKAETGTVKMVDKVDMSAKLDSCKAKYGFMTFNNLDALLKYAGNFIGEDLVGELTSSLQETASYDITFENGKGDYTDAEGNHYYNVSLFDFVSPAKDNASLYNANEVDKIGSKFPSITSSTAGATTTITLKIATEKATASSGGTPIHDGLMDTVAASVGSLDQFDSGSYIQCGQTTIVAEINADGTLNTLSINSPFEVRMKTTDKSGDTEMMIDMLLKGTSKNDFTFTR